MKNKGGAPRGNTNRQKGDTAATANLACRCTPELRRRVETAAAADGVSLSDWIVGAVAGSLGRRSE